MKKLFTISGLTFLFFFVASPNIASENTPPERPKTDSPKVAPRPKVQSPTEPPQSVLRKKADAKAAQKNREFNTNGETSGDPRAKGDH